MAGPLRPQRCEAPLEQRTGHLVSVPGRAAARQAIAAPRPAFVRIGVTCVSESHRPTRTSCAARRVDYDRATTRGRGDQELSAKKRSETEGADSRRSKTSHASDRGGRKRSSDLGRALRSVYDDTLREPVPDDFLNLLGKLS